MPRWLFKQEPECYGYADLERDGETTWDGISNPLALKHLAAVRPGDEVFLYHTGKEKAVVGVMAVFAGADGEAAFPRVRAVRRLANPVTLAVLKADKVFAGWELVRLPRLSVVPVSDAVWERIEALAAEPAAAPAKGRKTKKAAG